MLSQRLHFKLEALTTSLYLIVSNFAVFQFVRQMSLKLICRSRSVIFYKNAVARNDLEISKSPYEVTRFKSKDERNRTNH